MADEKLIADYLATKGAKVVRPGFAQGSEIEGFERKVIRRSWNK